MKEGEIEKLLNKWKPNAYLRDSLGLSLRERLKKLIHHTNNFAAALALLSPKSEPRKNRKANYRKSRSLKRKKK